MQGLITESHINAIKISHLQRLPLDVLFLQETHISSPSLELKFKQTFSQFYSCWNSNCGIIVKNPSLLPTNPQSLLNNRILVLDITWNSLTFPLVCVYAPAQNSSVKSVFFNECTNLPLFSPDSIWAGDFNCWLNPFTDHIPNTYRPPHGHMEFRQLQSWYGLMDSALAYQDRYPPMTRHNYVGGQVSSSSRIDYIFLTLSLNSFVSSSYTELFPNSDHLLLVTILKLPSSDQSAPKWLKILPCNVSGWRFKKDFAKSFQEITHECSLSQWDLFKKNLLGKAHKSQSQRLFSTRAKIR